MKIQIFNFINACLIYFKLLKILGTKIIVVSTIPVKLLKNPVI